MTGIQRPNAADGNSLFVGVVKGAALAVAMIWMLSLLFVAASLLTTAITGSPYGRQFATLIAVLVLFVSTLFLLLFAVPTLIKYYPRQRRSPERMEHAMSNSQTPERSSADASLLPGFIKGAAIAGLMTWVLSLLALLTASPHSLGDQLTAFIFLALASLFLVLFVLPASIISYARRR
jgi:hypothetical protein